MSTITYVPKGMPLAQNGNRYFEVPFTLGDRKIVIRLFDDRMKAKRAESTVKIMGTVHSAQDVDDLICAIEAKDNPTTQDFEQHALLVKAIGNRPKPWRMWTETRFTGKDMSLACNLEIHTFEDGTVGLKGTLALSGVKEVLSSDARVILVADYTKVKQRWSVTSKQADSRGYPTLEITPITVSNEKENA